MTKMIAMTDRELEVIHAACTEAAKSLEGYCRWIDDRPMLPAREVAVSTVQADAREVRQLALRIFEARLAASPSPVQTEET